MRILLRRTAHAEDSAVHDIAAIRIAEFLPEFRNAAGIFHLQGSSAEYGVPDHLPLIGKYDDITLAVLKLHPADAAVVPEQIGLQLSVVQKQLFLIGKHLLS